MYQFCPSNALVLIKVCPAVQVAGNVVPVAEGEVDAAEEKSTLFACVRRSIRVCAIPIADNAASATARNTFPAPPHTAARMTVRAVITRAVSAAAATHLPHPTPAGQ